jgi:prepilin-type N-terminal cleavage/methylation domain-containing protein
MNIHTRRRVLRSATPRRMNHALTGFTLVEVLVCVAVIVVLASLALVGVSRAWGRANAVKCLSNLHQIGNQISTVQGRNGLMDGFYSGQVPKLKCPSEPDSDAQGSYGPNVLLWGMSTVPNPTRTVIAFETKAGGSFKTDMSTPDDLQLRVDVTRHGSSAN